MYFYGFLFIPLCSFLELTFWYMLEFLDLFSTYQKCPLYTVNFFAFFFFHFPWNINIFVTSSNNSFMTKDVNHLQINTIFYCHPFAIISFMVFYILVVY